MIGCFETEKAKKLKILAFLFKECNNNCCFCFQKKYGNSIKNIDFFIKNVDSYRKLFDKSLSDSKKYDEISVNLMGGELFFEDETTEGLLDIINHISKYGITKIRFTSNLINPIFTKIERCLDRCRETGLVSEFFTSFDFGNIRFKTHEEKQNFYSNIDITRDICKKYDVKFGIETIRTRQMLKSFVDEDEDFKFFKRISHNALVCQNEIIGNNDLKLSSQESTDLWKLVLTRTPFVSDMRSHFFERGRNCLNITRRTIIGDSVFEGCYSQKIGPINLNDKIDRAISVIDRYGCYLCEYFNRCSLKCPYEDPYDKCDKKEVFRFMDDNGISI